MLDENVDIVLLNTDRFLKNPTLANTSKLTLLIKQSLQTPPHLKSENLPLHYRYVVKYKTTH